MIRYFYLSLMAVVTAVVYLSGAFIAGSLNTAQWDAFGKIILSIVWMVMIGAIAYYWWSGNVRDQFYHDHVSRRNKPLTLVKTDRRK